jgi:hypothetical protein
MTNKSMAVKLRLSKHALKTHCCCCSATPSTIKTNFTHTKQPMSATHMLQHNQQEALVVENENNNFCQQGPQQLFAAILLFSF